MAVVQRSIDAIVVKLGGGPVAGRHCSARKGRLRSSLTATSVPLPTCSVAPLLPGGALLASPWPPR